MLDKLRIRLVLFNPPDENGYESINDVWEVRKQSRWLLGVDGVASTSAEAEHRLEVLIETSEDVWEKADVTMAIPPRCRKLQPEERGDHHQDDHLQAPRQRYLHRHDLLGRDRYPGSHVGELVESP